jgi:16S rRNA (guanine966-N2)-methyltransferase
MTRVIAGAARGRRLVTPLGEETRPTSDRAREGLFSSLMSLRGNLHGARVLDLFAGSGAVGLEALSRGAAAALLVESEPKAAQAIRENIELVGEPGARLRVARVEKLVREPCPDAPFDVIFLDPPYANTDGDVAEVIAALAENRWSAPDALIVVERSTRGGPFGWPAGFEEIRSRRYGEGTLWYGRAAHA